MNSFKLLSACFFSAFLLVQTSNAADRFWIATVNSNWNNTSNWSTTSGGSGGASVPGTSDVVFFDGGGLGNSNLDVNVSITGLTVSSGYTSTISQGTSVITIGLAGATFSGGTFSGGNADITVSGSFTLSGTTFTSTSGTLSVRGNFTFSAGTFAHNNGNVLFLGTKTISGNHTLNNVEFNPIGNTTFTLDPATTLTVIGNLTFDGIGNFALNGGTIEVKGDIVSLNGSGGSATININGTGNQIITGPVNAVIGMLPSVIIDKPSGILTLVNDVAVRGNWTFLQGNIDATNATVKFFGSKTIAGSHALNQVQFSPVGNTTFTISLDPFTTLTILNTLTFPAGGGNFALNGGVIDAKGDIVSLNGSGGSATININGTGNQIITGPVNAVIGMLPTVIIDKPSGILTLVNDVAVRGNWTFL